MLSLYTFPAGFGLFSMSPFCIKSALMLELSGQPWQRSDMLDPAEMPHRKLPVLETPGGQVADSDGVCDWLEAQGADFDTGLDAASRAHARAWVRLAEYHLGLHLLQMRWNDDAVWPEVQDQIFQPVPEPMREEISAPVRKEIQVGLDWQGLARFTKAERMHRLEQDLKPIAALASERRFLMGTSITSADLSVAPYLISMLHTSEASAVSKRLRDDKILRAYLSRVFETVPLP
ncbi:glutathione S-transferase family protein [Leisingera daeponensis]|uniref:Glutathione S-transferase family protein n=1 Tax=Leisingera daeponensis TaxID=405746 RepID=A0ABS7NFW6_9RHOB|nr:glutathione S-transferase family protein [Leisingera daeponensis]MBY6140065.1 glutathione S-transferase family protein [Leisingera daeponensis]